MMNAADAPMYIATSLSQPKQIGDNQHEQGDGGNGEHGVGFLVVHGHSYVA